jgi:hypothetical protein
LNSLPPLKTKSREWAESRKVRPKFEGHSPQYIVHDRPMREYTVLFGPYLRGKSAGLPESSGSPGLGA